MSQHDGSPNSLSDNGERTERSNEIVAEIRYHYEWTDFTPEAPTAVGQNCDECERPQLFKGTSHNSKPVIIRVLRLFPNLAPEVTQRVWYFL